MGFGKCHNTVGLLMIILIVTLLLKGKMSPVVVLAVIPIIAVLSDLRKGIPVRNLKTAADFHMRTCA